MINKIVQNMAEAMAGIRDGAVVLIGGFGSIGQPNALIAGLIEQGAKDLTVVANNSGVGHAGLAALLETGRVRKIVCSFPRTADLIAGLIEQGAKDLTVVANNSGVGHAGLAALLETGRVRKIVCSFPRTADPVVFEALWRAGRIELEVVPQGTMAERMRAAGAGIPAFYTATAVGTKLADGKEERNIGGRTYLLEEALSGDVALIEAWEADRWGNLTYRSSARNFNPVMATAAARSEERRV